MIIKPKSQKMLDSQLWRPRCAADNFSQAVKQRISQKCATETILET